LTTVVVLGPVARFPDSKHVVSYTGLAPAVHASADTCHLGQITKQGSPLLRFVLVQAGLIAAHAEVDLKRHYRTCFGARPPSHRRMIGNCSCGSTSCSGIR